MESKIIYLRMQRQHLLHKASTLEYIELFRDCQPGQNVYWNGFGDPPSLSFRSSFDDIDFNRQRQNNRTLIKGRFAGGNVGWIVPEDIELFAAVYRKPLVSPTDAQFKIISLIENAGPLNIHQLKEETGMLVKEITPILHRLQEAFIVYEDQFDGEWDRAWYRFGEYFPDVNFEKYTKIEALKILLQRFAYRLVWFDQSMAKSFYKVPNKDLQLAINSLKQDGVLLPWSNGYILQKDIEVLNKTIPKSMNFIYAIHRNDFLYKTHEHILKKQFLHYTNNLTYDHEHLQYLLIDGVFCGASLGHFRNGPYDLNDVVCNIPNIDKRKAEIVTAIKIANYGKGPKRINGKEVNQ